MLDAQPTASAERTSAELPAGQSDVTRAAGQTPRQIIFAEPLLLSLSLQRLR